MKRKIKCLLGFHDFSEWRRTNPSNEERFLGDWKKICRFCKATEFRPGEDID